jgi:hypothetical protein
MKQVVYHGHYDHDKVGGNPRTGWVYVETIRDFGSAMPAPIPAKAEALMQSWQKHWEGIGTRDGDADAITDDLRSLPGRASRWSATARSPARPHALYPHLEAVWIQRSVKSSSMA